ncbi:MAG: tRNA guanosine(34) transglycosylase Tgt [Acidobacteria bacterium]|nr:tRNA guanosine(34) transglycosylase Tgt [Acidobacteriota bacterium]
MAAVPGFELLHTDPSSKARLGRIVTAHGEIETPVFMPVGTAASVKALPHEFLEAMDARVILGNTYHLYLRPGHERIRDLGGLHRFMSWPRAILTDSGGYQVFSHQDLRKISEEGVFFRSHLDGSAHFLTPEMSIGIQEALGADIIMAFDECTPWPVSHDACRQSMELTLRWARRCLDAFGGGDRWLFGIVQGGTYPDLRERCAEALQAMGFPGYAIGGLSVGEPKADLYGMTAWTAERLPADKPRYLMGVGTPEDLFECVARGVDMFDCVLPTRNARNGCLLTSRGKLVIKNARYAGDERPVDEDCGCMTCRRYSRAYLRHLFVSGEMLGSILNTVHNTHFYLDIMGRIRQSLRFDSFRELKERFLQRYRPSQE